MSPLQRVILKNLGWRLCVQIPVFLVYRVLYVAPKAER